MNEPLFGNPLLISISREHQISLLGTLCLNLANALVADKDTALKIIGETTQVGFAMKCNAFDKLAGLVLAEVTRKFEK